MPNWSRREFLGAAALAAGSAFSASAAAPAVPSRPEVIVHRGGYPGWPWVARVAPKKLVCVFRDDGVHDYSPTGRVLAVSSDDDGLAWSEPTVVVDEKDVDDRNAAVVALPDGTQLVSYNSYTAGRVSRPLAVFSRDGGATWSRPVLVADVDARTRAAAIALSSGDLLLPIYKAPGNGAVAALSGDGGKRWRLFDVPDPPGFLGDEWSAYEVARGRVVGILRNSGASDGYFWKTESRDGGQTWDRPRRTNVRDARSTSPAHFDYHGKTPLLTYADRRMVSVSMVTTADADFLAWDLDGRVPCYRYRPDEAPIADGSYPASVAVGPARRFVVDYEIRPEGKWISGYFVDLPQAWRA